MRIVLILMLTIFSCTFNTPTTGGVDVPNGVKGRVYKDNGYVANSKVYIEDIVYTEDGYNVNFIDSTYTDSLGNFYFENIASGKYMIFTSMCKQSAVVYKVDKDSGELVLDSINVKYNRVVKGRVLNGENSRVFIAGTHISSSIDKDGFYVLKNVPQGEYDISVINKGVVYILSCSIYSKSYSDTIFIEDLDININKRETTTYHGSVTKSYIITPKVYPIGLEPDWYEDKNFDNAKYLDETYSDTIIADIDSLTLLYVEEFPENNDDKKIKKLLQSFGIRTLSHPDSLKDLSDTTGVDLVFISYSADGSGIGGTYKKIPKPVLVMEYSIESAMKMSKFIGGDSTDFRVDLQVESSENYITKGLSGIVTVMSDTIEMRGQQPSSDANIVATNPYNHNKAVIFTYDKGDFMVDSVVAQERRVGFNFKNCAWKYNTTWETLLLNSIKWATRFDD